MKHLLGLKGIQALQRLENLLFLAVDCHKCSGLMTASITQKPPGLLA